MFVFLSVASWVPTRHGQILAVGKLDPEAPVESLTAWPRAIATGEDCIRRPIDAASMVAQSTPGSWPWGP